MWYRSKFTGKFVRGSAKKLINSTFGKGTFDKLVKLGLFEKVDDPGVVDILCENHSVVMAASRYRELHECTMKEAVAEVKKLKKDMTSAKSESETDADEPEEEIEE